MSDVWKKLNLKDQQEILVVNAPDSFDVEVKKLESLRVVRSCGRVKQINFILSFVTRLAEVERLAMQIAKKAKGDAVVWFAYPKQTSKKYQCEFNRDSGWQPLRPAGFKGVRQVAIDEDWSAIRFRRVEFIESTSRDQSPAQTGARKTRKRR